MTNSRENKYLTVTQAAKMMGVSRQTVYSWINDERIETIRTPSGRLRIPEDQLIITSKQSEIIAEDNIELYETKDISDLVADLSEQMGTKEKYWFWADSQHWYWETTGNRFLFKSGRVNTGENWAEVISADLCDLLGLPHAWYKFARYHELFGVITQNFVEDGARFIPGNEILAVVVKGYEKTKRYKQVRHTLRAVAAILKNENIRLPKGLEITEELSCALDVYVGYIMFDAWIANTDRHHENWGLVYNSNERSVSLAPTFDHAASLGGHERDEKRRTRLVTSDKQMSMERYVENARSALYSGINDKKPMFTLEALKKLARIRPRAATFWQNRLRDILVSHTVSIINKVPDEMMSETTREFTIRLLELNRERILNLNL